MHLMQDWQALAAAMIRRRTELGYGNRAKMKRDKGLSDTQYRLLMDIENVKRTNFEQGTLALVEVAYEWQPGSVQRILDGQSPVPVPRQPEAYAAHPPLSDEDTSPGATDGLDIEWLITQGFAQSKADQEAMERRLSERIAEIERRLDERP